jgi:hypothetical protein
LQGQRFWPSTCNKSLMMTSTCIRILVEIAEKRNKFSGQNWFRLFRLFRLLLFDAFWLITYWPEIQRQAKVSCQPASTI